MSYLGNAEYQRLYIEGAQCAEPHVGTFSGLITVDDIRSVSVHVATTYGQVNISTQLLAEAPRIDETWPDIAEVTIAVIPGESVELVNGSGDEIEEPEPILTKTATGNFRIRVHRSGEGFPEGQDPDGADDPRTEQVLILAWPVTDLTKPEAVRMTSPTAIETQQWETDHPVDDGLYVTDEMDED